MDHFFYKNGELYSEGVSIAKIAREVETPLYIYSKSAMETQYTKLVHALKPLKHKVFYSVKANSNISVLKVFKSLGAGMDVVSSGEYERAVAAGVCGENIVFSGVGKTKSEIQKVISGGIRQFNVESEHELDLINAIASEMGKLINVSIRVNPDVNAKTHKKITTGTRSDKFGVSFEQAKMIFEKGKSMKSLSFVGLDMHIGSQISDLGVFGLSFRRLKSLYLHLNTNGHNISRLDIGGGVGVQNDLNGESLIPLNDYGDFIFEYFKDLDCELELEPGRLLVGNSGILVSSVLYLKANEGHKFLIIDAAMNDLMRPVLYNATHQLVAVKHVSDSPKELVDVVGPVCESGDTFQREASLPPLGAGDFVALSSAGAYGAVMASEYNTRPLIPEVLVSDKKFAIIRNRPSISEIIMRDKIPVWLT